MRELFTGLARGVLNYKSALLEYQTNIQTKGEKTLLPWESIPKFSLLSLQKACWIVPLFFLVL
jgi:hypothetical protein